MYLQISPRTLLIVNRHTVYQSSPSSDDVIIKSQICSIQINPVTDISKGQDYLANNFIISQLNGHWIKIAQLLQGHTLSL